MTANANGSGEIKPGYKTTEFWGSVAVVVLSMLMASDVIHGEQYVKIAAMIGSALAALGYTSARALTKRG